MPPSAALIRYGGSGLPSQYTGAKLVLPKRSEIKKFLALESDRGRELPAIEASGRTLTRWCVVPSTTRTRRARLATRDNKGGYATRDNKNHRKITASLGGG